MKEGRTIYEKYQRMKRDRRERSKSIVFGDYAAFMKICVVAVALCCFGPCYRPMLITVLSLSLLLYITIKYLFRQEGESRMEKQTTPWYGKVSFWVPLITAITTAVVFVRRRWNKKQNRYFFRGDILPFFSIGKFSYYSEVFQIIFLLLKDI